MRCWFVVLFTLAHAAAAAFTFSVTLDSAAAGAVIPPDFVSFSWETQGAATMLFDTVSGGPRAPQIALMRHLGSYSGGSRGPRVRVGGNSADLSEFFANASAPFVLVNDTLRLTASDLAALVASVPLFNGSVTIALNMRSPSNPNAVAVPHALAAVAALGWGLLESFEIGNEADVYVYNGIRPLGYGSSTFTSEFVAYAAALGAAGVPPGKLKAPSTQGYAASWNASWLPPFLAAVATRDGNLSAVATHFYALSVCTPAQQAAPPRAADLLADDPTSATAKSLAKLQPFAAAAAAAGLPYHIGEGSAVACSGSPGTANSMPAALWALDVLYRLSQLNVSRFHFHGGPTGDNSAITFPVIGINPTRWNPVPQVAPLYYGLAAFNFAAANNARALPVQNASATGAVRCWAVVDALGARRVVLINKDATPNASAVAVTLQLSAPLSGNASVAALLPGAAGLSSTRGLTWRGLSWDNSTNGTPAGVVSDVSLAPSSPGVFNIVLPAAAALVITLPPLQPGPPSPPPQPLPPPSPPQPNATSAPTRRVSARIAIGGYTAAGFGATQQAAFAAALAARLGVASADVAVTGVLDYVSRRRVLLTSSVEASFQIAAKDDAAADALKAGIAAATSSSGAPALLAALQGAGLGAATSLQLTAPPASAPAASAATSHAPGALLLAALLLCVL